MEKLKQRIKTNGFLFEQIERTEKTAIYKAVGDEIYEVFFVKTRPHEVINGYDYPAREVYPSNRDFGFKAWSCSSRERAFIKFNGISEVGKRSENYGNTEGVPKG